MTKCPHVNSFLNRTHNTVKRYPVKDEFSCLSCLTKAIMESHRLLKHYAKLLNAYDGGKRDCKENWRDWVKRVLEVEEI